MAWFDSHDDRSSNNQGNTAGASFLDFMFSGDIGALFWLLIFLLAAGAIYKRCQQHKKKQDIKLRAQYPKAYDAYRRDKQEGSLERSGLDNPIDRYFIKKSMARREEDCEWGRFTELPNTNPEANDDQLSIAYGQSETALAPVRYRRNRQESRVQPYDRYARRRRQQLDQKALHLKLTQLEQVQNEERQLVPVNSMQVSRMQSPSPFCIQASVEELVDNESDSDESRNPFECQGLFRAHSRRDSRDSLV